MKIFEYINEAKQVKTIKVGEDAIGATRTHYALVKDRTVVAIGEKQEMLELCEKEGGRVWICAKHVGELVEGKGPCWKGYKQVGMKTKNGKKVPNCVPEGYAEDEITVEAEEVFGELVDEVFEAEYQGRKVTLNKPVRSKDGPKKFHVYVKDGEKVKKVNFGDPNMEIKKDSPERRKSFRARHNCDQKKDKTTAGYWSCKKW